MALARCLLLVAYCTQSKLASKNNDLIHEAEKSMAKRSRCKEATRKVRRDLGKLQRVIIDSKSGTRPLTPRPDWTVLEQAVAMDKSDVCTAQPSGMVVMDILSQMDMISQQVSKLQEKLPWAIEQKKREASMQSKWFVCKGTGPGIPKFLRLQGKVRNRGIQKADCEKFITEFWEARTKAKEKGGRESMIMAVDFLYTFLKGRFGVPTAIAEFGYNLMDGVKRYAYDADCELFHRIITGELCEDAYEEQIATVSKFQDFLRKTEARKVGKKKAKGTLSREEFLLALEKHFPFKSKADLSSLAQALIYDQPLAVINYEHLFEDCNQAGDQGKFAETLRDQHMSDIVQSYSAIEDAIRNEVTVNNMNKSGDEEALQIASVKLIKAALAGYDAKLPAAEVTRILACGLNLEVKDAPFSDYRKVDISTFCQRIRILIIKRYSVPPVESAKLVAAKQLRSLLPEERATLTELFAEYDTDYTDSITVDELTDLVDHVYPRPGQTNRVTVQAMFDVFDSDGSGEIQLDEFLHGVVCIPDLQYIATHAKWKKVFRRFDADNSGLVDEHELEDMLNEVEAFSVLEPDAQKSTKQKFLSSLNDDGEIGWDVFIDIMSQLTGIDNSVEHFESVIDLKDGEKSDDVTSRASQPQLHMMHSVGSTKYLSKMLSERDEMIGAVGIAENKNDGVGNGESNEEDEQTTEAMQVRHEIEAEAKKEGDASAARDRHGLMYG